MAAVISIFFKVYLVIYYLLLGCPYVVGNCYFIFDTEIKFILFLSNQFLKTVSTYTWYQIIHSIDL